MAIILNDIEVRVLGCLLEKSMTTPEYYPLSLNALTNACNQKSNRDPVVSFDDKTVARALESLKEKQLVVLSDSSRVPKYAEIFSDTRKLIPKESALLMVLLLRGPQTMGELRSRTERAFRFEDLAAVESTLADLIEAGYIKQLPRQPGRKESRYTHMLAGEPDIDQDWSPPPERATLEVRAENDKIIALANEVAKLREELSALRTDFETFKKEFE